MSIRSIQAALFRPYGVEPAKALGSKRKLQTLALAILGLLLPFLAYISALKFGFVYDDRAQIINNPALHSWRNLPLYFTSHIWQFSRPELLANYYRPLPMTWKLIHYSLFGSHPFWWHLSSIVVHTLVTALVFVLARQITRDYFVAVASAFVFGLHPVHVEAVAWVSGVTDPLLALLLLPAFILYVDRGRTGPRRLSSRACLLLSLLLYALGTLTKDTAVAFPGLIFLWEFLGTSADDRGSSKLKRLIIRYRAGISAAVPYLGVTVAYLLVRIAVLKGFSHVGTHISVLTIVSTWPSLIWFYIKSLIYPVNLSLFYDVSTVEKPGLMNFLLPLTAAAGSAALCWRMVRGSRAGKFAVGFMVLPLLPVLNLALFNRSGGFVHDRFLYLPSIGFAIVAGIAIRRLKHRRWMLFGQPGLQVATLLSVACLFGVLTAVQVRPWEDEVQLYSRAVRLAPLNNDAANNLAGALDEKGYDQQALDILGQLNTRDPDYWNANYNLGYISYKMGDLDGAEAHLRTALRMDPRSVSANFYLGITLLKIGHLDDAEAFIRRALELGPIERGFYAELGAVLELKGRRVEASQAYKRELSGYPDQTEVMKRLTALEATDAPEVPKHKSEAGKAAMSVVDSPRPAGILK
jgi:tetratricopeptide (TPR) repeat protein